MPSTWWLGPHGQPAGHRPPARAGSGGSRDDDYLLMVAAVAAAALLTIGALLWSAGQLAGRVTEGRWPRVPFAAAGGIALRLPTHLGEPAEAWPTAARGDLPGPVPIYAILVGELVLLALAAAWVWHRVVVWRGGSRRRARDRSLQWATRAQARHLAVAGPQPGRLLLGRLGRTWVAAEPRASLLVVAPTQAGKTTRLVVPNVLTWTGPLVVTSVKADVLRLTIDERRRRGEVALFDPTGATGLLSARWSPLLTCTTYEAAERTASWLVQAAGDPDNIHARYWEQLGARLLGPLLFAAARSGAAMSQVARWVDRRDEEAVQTILESLADADALDAWTATTAREERAKDSVYGTAEVLLRAFTSPSVREATTIRPGDSDVIDVGALLDGAATLYLVAPEHEQLRLKPLFAALVQAVVRAAQDRYTRTGQPLTPALLLMLDEAANIAPLSNLDTLAATGAGQGIQLCTVWQDLAQIDSIYGRRAATVINGHRGRLLLAGQSDLGTLDQLSRHIGEDELVRPAVSWSSDGRRSLTEHASDVRLAPVEYLRQLPYGEAITLYGNLPPIRLHTVAWYDDPDLRNKVDRDAADESKRAALPARVGSRV